MKKYKIVLAMLFTMAALTACETQEKNSGSLQEDSTEMPAESSTAETETESSAEETTGEESQESVTEETTIKPTLDYFENVDKEYNRDKIYREIGPCHGYSGSGMIWDVWNLEDGSRASIYFNSDEKIVLISVASREGEVLYYYYKYENSESNLIAKIKKGGTKDNYEALYALQKDCEDPPALEGTWHRSQVHSSHSAVLTIGTVDGSGFDFTLDAYYYFHSGIIENHALFVNETCAISKVDTIDGSEVDPQYIVFLVEDDQIRVLATASSAEMGLGMNVYLWGTYVTGEPVYTNAGILEQTFTERQLDFARKNLPAEMYGAMLYATQFGGVGTREEDGYTIVEVTVPTGGGYSYIAKMTEDAIVSIVFGNGDEYQWNGETDEEKALFLQFLDDKIPAYDSERKVFLYSDLSDPYHIYGDCDVRYVEENAYADIDNDGKQELTLWGIYGGFFLDVADGKVVLRACGNGTAQMLGYVYHENETWLVYADTTHMGRAYRHFVKLNGAGEIAEEFRLNAEYWESENDCYDESSTFTYNGEAITMEEYEEILSQYSR